MKDGAPQISVQQRLCAECMMVYQTTNEGPDPGPCPRCECKRLRERVAEQEDRADKAHSDLDREIEDNNRLRRGLEQIHSPGPCPDHTDLIRIADNLLSGREWNADKEDPT